MEQGIKRTQHSNDHQWLRLSEDITDDERYYRNEWTRDRQKVRQFVDMERI